MVYKYVYGPVPSRRLGRSLGVSLIPSKTCNYSCVYCQLGRTNHMTNTRQDFFPPEDILNDITNAVKINPKRIDYITFVGEGEPTLCASLGYLIRQTKSRTHLPVAVITNGSLLYDSAVKNDLLNADIVLPSLDAGSSETFLKINRPHKSINFYSVLSGLKDFSKVFHGQLWIEIMLVKNLNDSEEELKKFSKVLEDVNLDRVYINVPIRPPAEHWVEIPDEVTIIKAHELMRSYVIAGYENGNFHIANPSQLYSEILKICERHPMREEQIRNLANEFDANGNEIIAKLKNDPDVKVIQYRGKSFFVVKPKNRF